MSYFPDRYDNLTPEEEEKIIEKIANYVVKQQLEFPASLLLETYKPTAKLFTSLGLLYGFPFINMFGDTGFDYTSFFMKKENIQRLMNRIEELKQAREEKKKIEKMKQKAEPKKSLLDWIKGK